MNPETYKVPDAPQRSINGLCCDCCHGCCAKGPCGRFPFLGVGNQFLTPLQYANLARLGHELAAEPLAQLVEARAAARSWPNLARFAYCNGVRNWLPTPRKGMV